MKLKNNAVSEIITPLLQTGTSFICKNGEWDLFPTENFEVFLEYIENGIIAKREAIKISSRVGDVFTIESRAFEQCVQNETVEQKTRSNIALEFPIGSQISQYISEKKVDYIDDELVRLENDKLDKEFWEDEFEKRYTKTETNEKIESELNYSRVEDIRGHNYLPNDAKFKDHHIHYWFVEASIIGLPDNGEHWAFLQTINKWNAGSGINSHKLLQIATNSWKMFIRNSTSSTSWGEWKEVFVNSETWEVKFADWTWMFYIPTSNRIDFMYWGHRVFDFWNDYIWFNKYPKVWQGQRDEPNALVRKDYVDDLVNWITWGASLQRAVGGRWRYIKCYSNGSTSNTWNHYKAIRAFEKWTWNDVALHKTATGTAWQNGWQWWWEKATDGTEHYASVWDHSQSIIVDLWQIYDLESIQVQKYSDWRTYHNTTTEVSQDGANWFTVFDSKYEGEYVEERGWEWKTHYFTKVPYFNY